MSNEIETNHLSMYADTIENNLVAAAKSFMAIGEALVSAKLVIQDDVKFALWREEKTSIKSARTASAYMQVYRTFSETKLSGKVGYSVLQELVSASPEVIEKVEELVDAGETPTVKETRELVKEDKEDKTPEVELMPPEEKKTGAEILAEREVEKPKPAVPSEPSWLTDERMVMSLSEENRIKEGNIHWHILGLSAYFETFPSVETIDRLYYSLAKDYPDHAEILIAAKDDAVEETRNAQ